MARTSKPKGNAHHEVLMETDGGTKNIGMATMWPTGLLDIQLDALPTSGRLRIDLSQAAGQKIQQGAPTGPLSDLLQQRIQAALSTAEIGQFDGAHHKDWVIQEMIRILRGQTEESLIEWLGQMSWERGTPP